MVQEKQRIAKHWLIFILRIFERIYDEKDNTRKKDRTYHSLCRG